MPCSRCGFVEPEVRCLDIFRNMSSRFDGAQCQLEDLHKIHVHKFADRFGSGVAWDDEGNVARLGR